MFKLAKYIWSTKEKQSNEFTVAVAESVTAGALTNTLCSEPGASKFFKGGVIAYSIQSKKDILGIDIEYSEKHNFANPFTTSEMAKSVCSMFEARIGMATTGYSLPTSRAADEEKGICALDVANPYAYICLYDSRTNQEIIKKVNFTYDKTSSDTIQRASVQTRVALEAHKMYMIYKQKIQASESEAIVSDNTETTSGSSSVDTGGGVLSN
jgi:PncC family amidohydrolase